MRRTAERVDEQMENYRRDAGVREIWPASERILVCVGPNPRSVRLIRGRPQDGAGLRAEWIAAHVEAPSHVKASEEDLQLLSEHMRLAESLGAETVTLTGHKASEGDPQLCAPAQHQQDHRRKADTPPLERQNPGIAAG